MSYWRRIGWKKIFERIIVGSQGSKLGYRAIKEEETSKYWWKERNLFLKVGGRGRSSDKRTTGVKMITELNALEENEVSTLS